MSEEPRHVIAKFKAKYALSSFDLAEILGGTAESLRGYIESGECPDRIEAQISGLEFFINHVAKENKIMGEHSTVIQVLRHDEEMRIRKDIERLELNNNKIMERKIKEAKRILEQGLHALNTNILELDHDI